MKVEEVQIDLEEIKDSIEVIQNENLKNILNIYYQRIDQIFGSIVLPVAIMHEGLREAHLAKYFLEGVIQTGNVGKERTEEAKNEIKEFIRKKQEENDSFKKAVENLNQIRIDFPFIDEAIKNNGLNILVNTWTAFETSVKDAWRYALNKYPRNFIFNVTKAQNNTEIDGFNSKNISIGLLAKHNFNISNKLGDLIVPKFDFTGVNGIKKSLEALIKPNKSELNFLNNDSLLQLEIIRHLIVHNAGIIDSEYLRKSKRLNENLDEKIKLDTDDISNLCNESIYATIASIKLIDDKILSIQ